MPWSMLCALCTVCSKYVSNLACNEFISNDCMTNQRVFCISSNDRMHRLKSSKKGRRSHVIDSGASIHCINDKSMFDTVYTSHPSIKITVANKQVLHSLAVGSVKLPLQRKDGTIKEIIHHIVV